MITIGKSWGENPAFEPDQNAPGASPAAASRFAGAVRPHILTRVNARAVRRE
jgi:hypothetical protein